MKKLMIVMVAVIALGAAGFGAVRLVSAQGTGAAFGFGMLGRGSRGGMMAQGQGYGMGGMVAGGQMSWMHDAMVAAFAQKLGLTESELDTRLANSETMAQVAAAKGYSSTQFNTLMAEVRAQVFAQAVKDGKLTQAQADWMAQHSAGMMDEASACTGSRAGMGRGMMNRGQNSPAACPFAAPVAP